MVVVVFLEEHFGYTITYTNTPLTPTGTVVISVGPTVIMVTLVTQKMNGDINEKDFLAPN